MGPIRKSLENTTIILALPHTARAKGPSQVKSINQILLENFSTFFFLDGLSCFDFGRFWSILVDVWWSNFGDFGSVLPARDLVCARVPHFLSAYAQFLF